MVMNYYDWRDMYWNHLFNIYNIYKKYSQVSVSEDEDMDNFECFCKKIFRLCNCLIKL